MENYINNIVKNVKEFMKKGVQTPEEALSICIDEVNDQKNVWSRKNAAYAEDFVRASIYKIDSEIWRDAEWLDADLYKDAVLYGDWCTLDAMLYCVVCRDKKDEILRRVKESAE